MYKKKHQCFISINWCEPTWSVRGNHEGVPVRRNQVQEQSTELQWSTFQLLHLSLSFFLSVRLSLLPRVCWINTAADFAPAFPRLLSFRSSFLCCIALSAVINRPPIQRMKINGWTQGIRPVLRVALRWKRLESFKERGRLHAASQPAANSLFAVTQPCVTATESCCCTFNCDCDV